MKKILALSAVALTSAAAFALPTQNRVSRNIARPFFMQQAPQSAQELRPVELKGMKTMLNAPVAASETPAAKPADQEYGAFYGFGEGTYHTSLVWDGGWYSYRYALANGFPYKSKFNAILGTEWTMITASSEIDLSDNVDDEGNLVLSDLGIGNFYMPTIYNGKKSYLYGSTAEAGQMLINATNTEVMPFGMFDAQELEGFYSGVNTGTSTGPGYGSETPFGISGSTIVDFGQVAGPLVVESLNMWVTNLSSGEEMFETDEDYILVTLIDAQENDTVTYTSRVTADNIDGQAVVATFSDVDEDGFETEVYPVLLGDVTLLIENTPGCHYSIIMASSDVADVDKNGRSIYPSSTSWYHDGSQMSEGYYHWQGADAVVMLNAYYNAAIDYNTHGTECNMYVFDDAVYNEGVTWAFGEPMEDGKRYNDLLIESTFDSELYEVSVSDEAMIAGFDVDESQYEEYGVIAFFIAVNELPAGVTGRECDVVFISNGSAEYTVHVKQGTAANTGLEGIKYDAAKQSAYNLMGQKVLNTNAAGLYLVNGKKIMK